MGLNDTARVGRADGRHQLAPEAFLFGLQQLLRPLSLQQPVLVLGLTPVLEEAMPFAGVLWYSLAAARQYEGLLQQACQELDLPFLPRWSRYWRIPTGPAGSMRMGSTSTARAIGRCMSGCAVGRLCCAGRICSLWSWRRRAGEPWPRGHPRDPRGVRCPWAAARSVRRCAIFPDAQSSLGCGPQSSPPALLLCRRRSAEPGRCHRLP